MPHSHSGVSVYKWSIRSGLVAGSHSTQHKTAECVVLALPNWKWKSACPGYPRWIISAIMRELILEDYVAILIKLGASHKILDDVNNLVNSSSLG